MKRVLIVLLVIFCIIASGLLIAKDTIAKAALRSGLQALTGCTMEIGRMKVGLLSTDVEARGVRIANPSGFSDALMADIPELFVDYDLSAFLKGVVHLTELRLYLKELVVVRNPNNAMNVLALKGLLPSSKGSTPPPKITIDLLALRIGKVVYKEYGAQPLSREFILNLDERIQNVTDPKALLNTIIARALSSGGLGSLAGFDSTGLQVEARQAVQDVSASVSDTLSKTADDVKKLFSSSK